LRRPSIPAALNMPPVLTGNKVNLRPKRLQHAINDYNWRQDVELCHLDATIPILIPFKEFLENYIEELNRPTRACRFAIETPDGKHIGNCSYFNIDEIKNESEMGIMIGDRAYWNHGYGTEAILATLNHFFSQTNIRRVYLKTLNWNIRAQKCFQKCGFAPCGQIIHGDYNFIFMEIHRSAKLKCK